MLREHCEINAAMWLGEYLRHIAFAEQAHEWGPDIRRPDQLGGADTFRFADHVELLSLAQCAEILDDDDAHLTALSTVRGCVWAHDGLRIEGVSYQTAKQAVLHFRVFLGVTNLRAVTNYDAFHYQQWSDNGYTGWVGGGGPLDATILKPAQETVAIIDRLARPRTSNSLSQL